MCTSDSLYKLAVAGEGIIKFYNVSTWKEIKHERITIQRKVGKITKMEWSSNGQLLVITTANGHVYGYLTSVPALFSCNKNIVANLTSFTELCLIDCSK